ncbi:hypothetical protein [Bacillus sp. UMB0893]|uniref:hypothetical protein n=1 Tax=Bacillus sp. UMB0893 TaxID=2066053 RepID=UPI000C7752CD|nr:hypothetical protein [Bacillus sp. UMB0893]PLR67039.1 hypothetical protein CYJ36_13710 [Bacillus sp. UMB0893]
MKRHSAAENEEWFLEGMSGQEKNKNRNRVNEIHMLKACTFLTVIEVSEEGKMINMEDGRESCSCKM